MQAPRPARIRAALKRGGFTTLEVLISSLDRFFTHHGPQLAASISFYTVLSIFPLAIVLTAAFGLVVNDEAARKEVVEFLVQRLPLQESGVDDVRNMLRDATGRAGTLGLAGLVGLLYSASALMGATRNSLNAIWAIERRRPPLRGKALDILLVFALGTLFAASLVMGALTGAADDLGHEIGIPDKLLTGVLGFLTSLVPTVLSAIVFGVALVVLPDRRVRLRDIWPGIVVATVSFEIIQWAFGLYLRNFGSYSTIYGSLGTAVATMVFVYITAMALLIAAEIGRLWPEARSGELGGDGPSEPVREQVWRFLRGLVMEDPREKR